MVPVSLWRASICAFAARTSVPPALYHIYIYIPQTVQEVPSRHTSTQTRCGLQRCLSHDTWGATPTPHVPLQIRVSLGLALITSCPSCPDSGDRHLVGRLRFGRAHLGAPHVPRRERCRPAGPAAQTWRRDASWCGTAPRPPRATPATRLGREGGDHQGFGHTDARGAHGDEPQLHRVGASRGGHCLLLRRAESEGPVLRGSRVHLVRFVHSCPPRP